MNCKWRYADLIKPPTAFSLDRYSWIGGYERFFMTVYTTRPLQNFEKHLWKYWFWVKFSLAAYAFTGYDFIGLIRINDISIYIETFISKCVTFLHWIVWRMTVYGCLCLLTESMLWKQKHLLQSAFIAYSDPFFWSKT